LNGIELKSLCGLYVTMVLSIETLDEEVYAATTKPAVGCQQKRYGQAILVWSNSGHGSISLN